MKSFDIRALSLSLSIFLIQIIFAVSASVHVSFILC